MLTDKSYSILILQRQGTRIRHLIASRRSIRILACTVLILLGLSVWLLADYFWMKFERGDLKTVGAHLSQEVATLRAQVQAQQENLLSLKERLETSQRRLAKLKLERDDLKIMEARLKNEVTGMSARYKHTLVTVDAKHRREVTEMSARHKQTLTTMGAKHQKEVNAISSMHNEEMNTLNTLVEQQREKLLALQDQAVASQQLLANWKGLREEIRHSLPRKRRSSLTGQEIVGELESTLTSLQGDLEGLIASIPSEWPAKGWVSSRFGRRRSPWTGKSDFHSGIDIANRRGTPVYAPGDAVVEFAGTSNGNGKSVVLNHGQGITTLYGHLSKMYVKKGDRVRKKQKIANVGNTGKSTNPHLHYEVRVNGAPINPRSHLLKQKSSLP
jgi:murein DD-endopeptidase MepM/ murein hydrolase activator NlpD